jgi:hypothetical protein
MTRSLLASLSVALLAATACGSAKPGGSSASKTLANATSGVVYDSDDSPVRFFGHEANAVDAEAITALVRRYYTTASREEGTEACSLMAPLTVERLPEESEEQPELRGKTCAAIMSKLFERDHNELIRDTATLQTLGIRIEGDRALVLLRLVNAPIPDHFAVHREGRTWMIWEPYAVQMP